METHWSTGVVRILQSKSGSLKELADLAGVDWRVAYIGQSLAGCDLRGQDLSGMDLTDCQIERAHIDANTIIDPKFDPRAGESSRYIDFIIPNEVARIVELFAKEHSYRYVAWAYKNLVNRFVFMKNANYLSDILDQIGSNPQLEALVNIGNSDLAAHQSLLIDREAEDVLIAAHREFPKYNIYALSLIAPALAAKMVRSKKSDISPLTINAIWPRK